MSRDLTFLFVHGAQIGYGRTGVHIAEELKKRGVTIYDNDGHVDPRRGTPSYQPITSGYSAPPSPTNAVCWVSVPTHAGGWYQGQHRSILTMWESMQMPPQFRETIHEFDLVMVPSWQNLELFGEYHDNVKLVLLGVDPDLWHYKKPSPPGQTFNFLISGRGSRKGVDLTFEAFKKVFHNIPVHMPHPRLIMKSLKGHGDYYSRDVTHVTGKLEAQDEVDLYASAHCYVQPSRGEGFGLQPLQALALGRPTILTNAHGHESFAHLGVGLDATPSTADYFIYGDAGEWWEPDFEQLCEAMWDVYINYESHCGIAEKSAAEIAQHWTWSNTTDSFLEHLGPELVKPYTGSGAWEQTTRKLFCIITSEDHYSEAAGISRFFKKGEVYWDLADIKRILFDAGKLAPACLGGDDVGLMPEQVAQLDQYNAAHSFCPTCSQPLNSQPNRSDLLFAEMEEAANAWQG